MAQDLVIAPVSSKADFGAFIDLSYRLNANDPNWVPQLRAEEVAKFSAAGNPYFDHARVQLLLARQDGRVVGRIAAHIDELALAQPAEQGKSASDRSSRRLFERLVSLGAVRELTGRPTFRLYGL